MLLNDMNAWENLKAKMKADKDESLFKRSKEISEDWLKKSSYYLKKRDEPNGNKSFKRPNFYNSNDRRTLPHVRFGATPNADFPSWLL